MDSEIVYSYVYQVKRMEKHTLCSDFNHEISPPNAAEIRLDKFRFAMLDLDQPDPVNHLVYSLKQKLFHESQPAVLNPCWNQPVPPDDQLRLLLKITDVTNAALAAVNEGKDRKAIQICVVLTIKKRVSRAESDDIMEQTCVICLNKFKNLYEITDLPCGCKHLYHQVCVWRWVEKKRSCPICRCDFTKPVAATAS